MILDFVFFTNPLTKSHKGPYQARNYALSYLRGDFVCFLDIDDFGIRIAWSLSSLIDDCEHKPLLLYSSYYRFDTSKCLAIKRFSTWPISPKVLIRFTNIVPMLTACVSTDLIRSQPVHFQPVSHEDYIFWRSLFDNVPTSSIIVDTNALAYYTICPESFIGQ